jgi:hypothetical protein
VILDCLGAGMTAEEITAEYPMVTVAGVRARCSQLADTRAARAPPRMEIAPHEGQPREATQRTTNPDGGRDHGHLR